MRLKSLPVQWVLVAIAERSAWAILKPWRAENLRVGDFSRGTSEHRVRQRK